MKHKTITNLIFAITTHLLIASLITIPLVEKPQQPKGHKGPVIEIVSVE